MAPRSPWPRLLIDRDPAFGMELAQGHVERSFVFTDQLQAIHRKIETFADADSGSPYEAKGMGFERITLPELLLQVLILVGRKRPGQIMVVRRKVLAANQI